MRGKGYWRLALAAMLSVAAAACGSDPGRPALPAVAGNSRSLLKTSWILVTLGPKDQPKTVIPGTEVTANFGERETPDSDGRVGGVSGCNHYGGDYTTDNGKLAVSDLASTKMFCTGPEGVMEQETEYLRSLQAAESYRILDGGVLEITTKDGRLLRFHERK